MSACAHEGMQYMRTDKLRGKVDGGDAPRERFRLCGSLCFHDGPRSSGIEKGWRKEGEECRFCYFPNATSNPKNTCCFA
jgi:hypothetical protein